MEGILTVLMSTKYREICWALVNWGTVAYLKLAGLWLYHELAAVQIE